MAAAVLIAMNFGRWVARPLAQLDTAARSIADGDLTVRAKSGKGPPELRRMAAVDLDGVPVETSVIFGDRAVEIGVEAECFNADLVVMPFISRRPSPAAVIRQVARRLFAGRSAAEFDVLRVSALRAEPTA